MKLAPILILCLAIGVHQTRAEPLFFDAISAGISTSGSIAQGAVDTAGSVATGVFQAASRIAQGVIGTVTGIGKGIIGAGTGAASNLANVAQSVSQTIGQRVNEVKSKILQRALVQVQSTLQKVQDSARGALQVSEIAGKKVKENIIEVENKQQESIQKWADEAKNKLSNASEETQLKGQDLIEGFANQRSEDLKQCTDKVISQLEKLQEKANATAKRYHEPMNKLIKQIGKCSELKANDFRGLANCSAEIRKDLRPLSSAPIQLGTVKAELIKAGIQNLQKNVCVGVTLAKFHKEASRVDGEINQLVAEDKNKQEQAAPEEEPIDEPASEEPTSEEPASEEPASEEAASEEPASEEPASEEPTSEEPAPSSDAPESEEPSTGGPASEAPASEEPASEEPASA